MYNEMMDTIGLVNTVDPESVSYTHLVFSVPSNYFITYPAYVQFYHMPLEAILGMYQACLLYTSRCV